MKSMDFLKVAIRDYKKVGAITLSSRYTIRRVLKGLKPEYKQIVEYGAGNGVVTKEILKALPSDGKVVAIELNDELFEELSKIKDDRLILMHGDVLKISEDLRKLGLPRVDAVISNIPTTLFGPEQKKELVRNTYSGLEEGGRFIVYQYSLLIWPILKDVFKKASYSIELRNLPPYFVMIGEKSVV